MLNGSPIFPRFLSWYSLNSVATIGRGLPRRHRSTRQPFQFNSLLNKFRQEIGVFLWGSQKLPEPHGMARAAQTASGKGDDSYHLYLARSLEEALRQDPLDQFREL